MNDGSVPHSKAWTVPGVGVVFPQGTPIHNIFTVRWGTLRRERNGGLLVWFQLACSTILLCLSLGFHTWTCLCVFVCVRESEEVREPSSAFYIWMLFCPELHSHCLANHSDVTTLKCCSAANTHTCTHARACTHTHTEFIKCFWAFIGIKKEERIVQIEYKHNLIFSKNLCPFCFPSPNFPRPVFGKASARINYHCENTWATKKMLKANAAADFLPSTQCHFIVLSITYCSCTSYTFLSVKLACTIHWIQ